MRPLVPTDVLNISLFGPFGAGKGTQAQMLVDRYDLKHFVAGELLKEEIRRKTALGRRVEPIVRSGRLVPDKEVTELLTRFLRKLSKNQGIVIDGSPRNMAQKKLIDQILVRYNRRPIYILIDISQKESLRRLAKRKICVGCGIKPLGRDLRAAACRACGGKLVQRYDDRPEIIKKRLVVYKKEVLPVIREYDRAGRMHRINGNQDRAGVSADLVRLLSTLGFTP